MKHWIDEIIYMNIDEHLDKRYVDFLNNLNSLIEKYNDAYLEVEEFMTIEDFDDLYLSHMSGAAALDASDLALKKKKDRTEILEVLHLSKNRHVDRHFDLFLERTPHVVDVNYLLHIDEMISPDRDNNRGNLRVLSRKVKIEKGRFDAVPPSNIETDLQKLVDFINSVTMDEYALIKVGLIQLIFLKILPFWHDNVKGSSALAGKLMQKYFTLPIFFETPMLRVGNNRERFAAATKQWFKRGEVKPFLDLIKDVASIEIKSNTRFIEFQLERIEHIYKLLEKTDIKPDYFSKLIRFLIINNIFKIKELHDRLPIKDRRTVIKMTEELERVGLIYNTSNTRVKKYTTDSNIVNSFHLIYK